MHRFAQLFENLDMTTSTRAKVEAMRSYFEHADSMDAAWATYVLIGRRLKRTVGPAQLRAWLLEEANLPPWLIEESYGSIGDLAETIALLVPSVTAADPPHSGISLSDWFNSRIVPLASLSVTEKRRHIVSWWHGLPYRECFLVNKLLTGSLRVGVSRSLVTRALAETLDQARIQVERALIGPWHPSADFWRALTRNEGNLNVAQPYPFYLASSLDAHPEALGHRADWLAEWKWDGIRAQAVRRAGACVLWSRGEEIVTERFPEIAAAVADLPEGTVLDGEILAWRGDRVLPFSYLQQRIGRKKLTAKILEEVPVRFLVYDLLETDGGDIRTAPLSERRAKLQSLLRDAPQHLGVSPEIAESTWSDLAAARALARSRCAEGVMLKLWSSAYGTGRQRGAWWKWKIEPFVFDGVLLYAAPGHGRRSNLYTDYTFGVWSGESLVPIAKAYSGLTDKQIVTLDRWIRTHTKEKFGTVRSVDTSQVFELAYEGIARSPRHKSGIALRFPRILRWRTDKPATEADTLESLQSVLSQVHGHVG